MTKSYEDYEVKHAKNFIRVKIDPNYVKKIEEFVTKLVKAKVKELHHQKDCENEIKRFTTGLLGEAALEKLFNIKIIDWTIGYSDLYNIPDIPGYKVGIKTVERNKFPVIFKKNDYPQIICVRSLDFKNLVFVCGLATEDVLNQYQDDELIIDPNLRKKGTKTGFYGFEQLIPVCTLNDILDYKKESEEAQ